MDYNLNTNGYRYLNELFHNENGNPHPQYVSVKEMIKLPENNQGKFVKFATFERKGRYYSSIFEFEIGVFDHNNGSSVCQCYFELNKLTSYTAKMIAYNQINMTSENIKAIVTDHSDEYIKIEFYISPKTNSELYFKPLNTLTYGSPNNNEYKFNVEVKETQPHGQDIICKNSMKFTENNIEIFRDLIPNSSQSLGSNEKKFAEVNGQIVRVPTDGYVAMGYGNELALIKRDYNQNIVFMLTNDGSDLREVVNIDKYGNIKVTNSNCGIKLVSPNGSTFKVTITDGGNLSTEKLS